MEEILSTYYENNANRLHKVVNKIVLKFGGISDKDMDDFYSLANEVFVDVIRRYDGLQSFEGFLYSCLSNKIMSEITKRNREKRKVDRMSVSIDTPISDNENYTIGDMIADTYNIEDDVLGKLQKDEWRKEINDFLNKLSPLQRKIAFLLSNNNTPNEISEELHITMNHFENSMKRILSDENTKPLRPLVERK